MRSFTTAGLVRGLLAAGLALALVACSTSDEGTPDQGVPPGDGPAADAPPNDTVAPKGPLKVAAVQYAPGAHQFVSGCADDTCGLKHFVREAAGKGAKIVVTPEYCLDQVYLELSPEVGDKPATDAKWEDGHFTRIFARLADELGVTVIFNLQTQEGTGAEAKAYNALIAIDGSGTVVARHYKFQLFGGEAQGLTPGPSIATSLFDTPAGRATMLICADAQCLVTGLTVTADCSSHAIEMLRDVGEAKPRIVFLSEAWTVGGTGIWGAIQVQSTIAKSFKAWVVAANTIAGQGKGGGVTKPDGEALEIVQSAEPTVVYGEIPPEQ